jgi:chemotaxis response regulator CheB
MYQKPEKDRKQPSRVVAVLGLLQGLKAFTSLLKALASDTGMAFVILSHLMHEQKANLGGSIAQPPDCKADCHSGILSRRNAKQ